LLIMRLIRTRPRIRTYQFELRHVMTNSVYIPHALHSFFTSIEHIWRLIVALTAVRHWHFAESEISN